MNPGTGCCWCNGKEVALRLNECRLNATEYPDIAAEQVLAFVVTVSLRYIQQVNYSSAQDGFQEKEVMFTA